MIELTKEMLKQNLHYAHEWDAAIESRGDSPLSDARVFLALAIKLIEEKLVGGHGEDWIPIEMRPGTDEEYEEFSLYGECPREDFRVFECQLPDDDQEVLVTTRWGDVCTDIWHRDVDCCYFENNSDDGDVIAWMPKPEKYQAEVQHDSL